MGQSNWLDSTISFVSPTWGAKRQQARTAGQILGSYSGAVPTRLSTAWPGSTQSGIQYQIANSYALSQMRNRARQLERNNIIADGLLNRCVDNVIGTGFELQSTTDDNEWNKKAEGLFYDWFDTADITGLTWAEHQRLVFRSHIRDGDVGSILLREGRLQAIESDLISTPTGRNDDSIIDGVGLNQYNRPTRFFIAAVGTNGNEVHRAVDANDFVFLPRLKRLNQVRGESAFTQSFGLFDQLDGYIEAVIVAARMAACFGVAITKAQPNQFLNNLGTTGNRQGQQQREMGFEPGMMPVLEPGESITTINPSQPQQSFPDSLTMFMRLLGLSLGMPIELVLLDFSRTSYASARASMIQAYRSFESMQKLMTDRYLARIYRWRVSKFINDGQLPARPDAFEHRWIAPQWPYLDPIKELQAMQMSIDVGTETLASVLTSQGKDWDEMVTQRKAELDALRAGGIPIYHSAAMQTLDQRGEAA
ncbi:MAG TPA: phage portal protein [Tepidisphaeraceae bacterium]|nr:phage portal protein [Tepidisphaeraceae bacterium]